MIVIVDLQILTHCADYGCVHVLSLIYGKLVLKDKWNKAHLPTFHKVFLLSILILILIMFSKASVRVLPSRHWLP